ncbi:hypothetical protein PF005_g2287 [Phytophthora fragariae]|uniref:Secreted protein n=2 Tax=Phytophthora TaxID=4783 RepID=A0A6A3TL83_9STRA|nr:hypothetical protein PF003_g32237 [Phytophthora fragariae]KAE9044739.1 hypothetical protein PR002_g2640 [Phytophthora rubi]KAE8947927.1 hypothetical protein PF009_g2481 [Phytophthora fragariae]KAE9029469.1 hypothetical protein PF011_g1064 [Phytophthora fragariae]KAE9049927.1 hypothetical protein PR001_g2871 [Phytophthora rubi]
METVLLSLSMAWWQANLPSCFAACSDDVQLCTSTVSASFCVAGSSTVASSISVRHHVQY